MAGKHWQENKLQRTAEMYTYYLEKVRMHLAANFGALSLSTVVTVQRLDDATLLAT